jgi:nucleotide-binding universal stress UspA family protein
MKVLLAVDGSACSEAAVKEVARRPWPVGTTINVLAAIEPYMFPGTETWVMPESYYEASEKAERGQAQTAVDEAAGLLRRAQGSACEVLSTVQAGHAPAVILDEAERWGADLIVVGSHGYRGFKRFLLGSVSNAVATHAQCSVAIVREREAHA